MRSTSTKKDEERGSDARPWNAAANFAFTPGLLSGDEASLELCEAMIDISAALFNVSSKEMRKPGRSTLDIARVRQIAMYVCHVVLRLSMTDIGKAFGRDRTTVIHACHLIEDLRDDEDFDHIISTTERVAIAAFRNRIEA